MNFRLFIPIILLVLISGCSSLAGNPNSDLVPDTGLETVEENPLPGVDAPALDVDPIATPSPPPPPTPTTALESAAEITMTTPLSETAASISGTLATGETTHETKAGEALIAGAGINSPGFNSSSPITPTMVAEEPESPAVNGIPVDSIIVFPEEVAENVRRIFALGQDIGRDAHTFSKLGDSLIATPSFLTTFDDGTYNLGPYDYLQPTIDYYAGSYQRYGLALRPGLHAWGVFDPLWANKEWCQPNENLLACEFRLNNPSVVLVLLGTNDAGHPPGFANNMRQVVEFSIENGVIPIIVTKADRFEGPDNTNNNILRQIAADYQVPLWDFDLVAETLPGRGLAEDQVHLTVFVENDYTMPEAFQTGTGVHNLTGLMALDAVRRAITEEEK